MEKKYGILFGWINSKNCFVKKRSQIHEYINFIIMPYIDGRMK